MVNDEGVLVVKAPKLISRNVIENFLLEKEKWISKQLSKAIQKFDSKKQFLDGEKFSFLGKEYELRFVEKQKELLKFDDAFTMRIKVKDKAKKIFEKWYKEEARKYFIDRLVDFSEENSFEFLGLKLSSAKRRWGSCASNGNINLNWKLIMASEEIVDYVIVHELVHTKHHNHSVNFWNAVEKIIPDYKKRRKWLKDNGHTLTL
jgi:hypothetical protein